MDAESKIVIGLVGEKGGGKQTFTHFLREAVLPRAVSQIRSSDVLFDTFALWNIPGTRVNLQRLAIVMDEEFGKGTLTHAVEHRIERAKGDIVVFDGVRWFTDVQIIRGFPRNLLVYVTADLNLRYQRLKANSDKVAERGLSFAQFMEEEKAKTEIDIPQIGATADFRLNNNSGLENLKHHVKRFYQDFLVPQLS